MRKSKAARNSSIGKNSEVPTTTQPMSMPHDATSNVLAALLQQLLAPTTQQDGQQPKLQIFDRPRRGLPPPVAAQAGLEDVAAEDPPSKEPEPPKPTDLLEDIRQARAGQTRAATKKTTKHKGHTMPSDGSPYELFPGGKIYTRKATPEFETNIKGKTQTFSYKRKRTVDEAWAAAVDNVLAQQPKKKK